MTLPEKESPAEGQGLDHVGRDDLNNKYSNQSQSATPDAIATALACRSCLAFNAWDNGQGECRRYAPRPNESTPMFGEWPRVGSGDYCMEFAPKMGGE